MTIYKYSAFYIKSMVENDQSSYVEYFKIIQNAVDRIARNSFLIKAWAITLIGGIGILAFSIINTLIFSVLTVIVLFFWILDSYYLRIERLYRALYNETVEKFNNPSLRKEITLFDMKIERFYESSPNLLKVMLSDTEILFYLSLIIGLLSLLLLNIVLP